jgi:hypothetical protein
VFCFFVFCPLLSFAVRAFSRSFRFIELNDAGATTDRIIEFGGDGFERIIEVGYC